MKVTFEEDQNPIRRDMRQAAISRITGFFIKNSGGLIKDQKSANAIMILVSIIAIVLAVVFAGKATDTPAVEKIHGANERAQMQKDTNVKP